MFSEFNIQDSFLLPEVWTPSCNSENNKEYPIQFDTDYEGNQLFMSSDRIVIDSRQGTSRNDRINGIVLSSFDNIEIGTAENLNIHTAKSTTIDSKNIYIGKKAGPAEPGGAQQGEPLVLGEQLKELLEKMIDAIGNLAVSGTIGGMSGPTKSHPSYKGLEAIKREFKDILSTKHFIENN